MTLLHPRSRRTSRRRLPTPPLTPFQDANESLARDLKGLLESRTNLVGRTKDMIFTRVQGLIKTVEERRLPGLRNALQKLTIDSQIVVLEEIIGIIKQGDKGIARDRIVKMMSEERGIAAWATALRIFVENLP
jgi:hypothetical protein